MIGSDPPASSPSAGSGGSTSSGAANGPAGVRPGGPSGLAAGAGVLVAPSARGAEAWLVGELVTAARARIAAGAGLDPAGLTRPLRIVVPSRSLRAHVCGALARAGGALLGVVVQTHRAAALEVLERAGEEPPAGAALVPVLVRRFAREEPVLAAALADLEDAASLVEATVRDLLDAGLTPAHADVAEECLAAAAAGADARARAVGVVRVAARVGAALEAEALGHRSTLLLRAREILERCGPDALPTAGLWIHGFADATALVADWLAALARSFAARVAVVVPRDPGAPERVEGAFSAPFAARMEAATGRRAALSETTVLLETTATGGAPALLRCPGATAEARAVADRVRVLLDAGARPESIGIVARQLEPWRAVLDAQLGRLGVPFSAAGASAGPDAATRRARALAELLAREAAAPVECWLAADAGATGRDADLRVALHVLNAPRLVALVDLDLEKALGGCELLSLPVRRGLAPAAEAGDPDEDGDAPLPHRPLASRGGVRNQRRWISRARLEAAQQGAALVLERLRARPKRAAWRDHAAALRELLESALGWHEGDPVSARVLGALDAVEADVPPALELGCDDMALLVADVLGSGLEPPLGGAGAGVQLLTVTEARGRTFDHLFVLGLNRDVFPRVPVEDPLLSDALRAALATVLPDVPVKRRGYDEERHLFAELLSSSPSVTLSWQHASDEGRERVESAFVARLRLLRDDVAAPQVVPMLFDAPAAPTEGAAAPPAPRPAFEHAALAGLHGSRRDVAALRPLAVEEALRALGDDAPRADVSAVADVQVAALRELDASSGAARLGPFFGYVGARAPTVVDGTPELYATRLEDLARCPWQSFLRRELGLEPVPDALAALPAPDARLVGIVVHRALEEWVRAALGAAPAETLAEAWARGPTRVPAPDAHAAAELLAKAARVVSEQEGLRLPGFAEALAAHVRPMFDVALRIDGSDPGGIPVLGAELDGSLVVEDVEGRPRRIGFRADRADRLEGGVLRLTDYKTGKPVSEAKREQTRRRHFEAAVAEARRVLQAPAYWLGAHALAERARGRLLYLRDGLDDASREVEVDDADGAIVTAFESVARTVLAAWDAGTLFPRLVGPNGEEPQTCRWCDVSAACLRGESGHGLRLRDWAARSDAARDRSDAALLALQRLGEPDDDSGVRGGAPADAAEAGES